jgi:hypothetical protein
MRNRKLRVYNIPLTLPSPVGGEGRVRGVIQVKNYAF